MIGIIGGTGVYRLPFFDKAQSKVVETPYGEATAVLGQAGERPVAFIPRHGAAHGVPPHRVNYRANIWALKDLGAQAVIGIAAVGSLRVDLTPGTLVIVDQFIDFSKTRPTTFFDDEVVHTDMTEPYCSLIRREAVAAAKRAQMGYRSTGCYVCTEGPRFETAAEVRMFAQLGGDVVGMTNAPEAVLAREIGLCYGVLALVTNLGAGLSKTPLTHQEVAEMMAEQEKTFFGVIEDLIAHLPQPWTCTCGKGCE
ncbi:MAG TPA: S-methyl-5'-thioadenosine phosphorylase [Firmicutes bacterium]|jgi:5'-methylthioadenosine phosphorylase|nr:S-methyl-5'-thioadenosine phosphorylase [Bacillota bacterium]